MSRAPLFARSSLKIFLFLMIIAGCDLVVSSMTPAFAAQTAQPESCSITTVAGNGTMGFSGDGGPATNAHLSYPYGLAVDVSGNLYIADYHNHRIRKVDPNGIITTVVGNGTALFSGDGGPATNARLSSPYDVTFDTSGNLYIADSQNHRIRKVAPTGIITTIAGNGTRGFSGDGGPATNAQLNLVTAVAVDASGNLYIADSQNHRIRKVDSNGIITTIAGNGTNGFSGDGGPAMNAQLRPIRLTVDASGALYIADSQNHRIRKVAPTGIITTIAGNGTRGFSGDGGPATNAQLWGPSDVALDALGNLYIGDLNNYRIRKVDSNGIITTIAGNGTNGFSGDGGPAMNAQLRPIRLTVDASGGNLYITDFDFEDPRIRKVTCDPVFREGDKCGDQKGDKCGDQNPDLIESSDQRVSNDRTNTESDIVAASGGDSAPKCSLDPVASARATTIWTSLWWILLATSLFLIRPIFVHRK